MRNARLIQDFRDKDYRPTRRTLADGLWRLEQELKASRQTGRWHVRVPHETSRDPLFAAIWFRADEGDDLVVAYPFSKGCRAITESGQEAYLALADLDGAVPHDEEDRLLLKDGRILRALEFDIFPHPRDFNDLEHAIVYLTVRFLNADHIGFCYIPEPGFWWIDYSRLHELCVQNVKELALHINAHIGRLPRPAGEAPLGPVSLEKIRDTLSVAGIRKARGRKPKIAA